MRKVLILVVALSMLVVACGDGGGGADTTTAGGSATTTEGADTTVAGGTDTTASATTAAPSDTTAAAGGEPTGDPIKIGAVLGISGRFAFVGAPQQNALLMAQEEMNSAGGIAGRPVEFVIYDDEVDETKTVPLTNRLIGEDGVIAVIGPSITIPALAVGPIFEHEQVPNVTLTSRAIWEEEGLEYVYQTTPREEIEVLSILSFIQEDLGVTKIGVLYDAQPYGTGNLAHIEHFAPELGLEVVATESIESADTDAVGQLERLRDAGAEVLIIWVGDPAASSAAKGLEQLGWDVPTIGSSAIAGPTFIELGGAAAEGVYSNTTYNYGEPPPNQAGFLSSYTEQFDGPPTQFAAFAYDAAYALKSAIELTGGDTEGAAIIQALQDIEPLEGVTATYDFTAEDHNGLGLGALFYIVQVQDGEYTVVADTREYDVSVDG